MGRGVRRAGIVGAVVMLGLAAVPLYGVADRLLPHAVELDDLHVCGPSNDRAHGLVGVAGPVLPSTAGAVRITDVHPLGLSEGARWRAWSVPIAGRDSFIGFLDTASPPDGWADRVPAAGAEATGSRPSELVLEVWPGTGQRTTSLRGVLVAYRDGLGLPRTARSTLQVETRVGGCA
jgi:hypothetical protein